MSKVVRVMRSESFVVFLDPKQFEPIVGETGLVSERAVRFTPATVSFTRHAGRPLMLFVEGPAIDRHGQTLDIKRWESYMLNPSGKYDLPSDIEEALVGALPEVFGPEAE